MAYALKNSAVMDPESPEVREQKVVGQRLQTARKAVGLSLDGAAQAFGVAKSTIQRWESGELKPRDHWRDVERIYKRSRLELEFGVAANGTGAKDPPYSAWGEFLSWLEDASERLSVQPWMFDYLRMLRLPEGREMTIDGYKVALHGLLAMPTKESRK